MGRREAPGSASRRSAARARRSIAARAVPRPRATAPRPTAPPDAEGTIAPLARCARSRLSPSTRLPSTPASSVCEPRPPIQLDRFAGRSRDRWPGRRERDREQERGERRGVHRASAPMPASGRSRCGDQGTAPSLQRRSADEAANGLPCRSGPRTEAGRMPAVAGRGDTSPPALGNALRLSGVPLSCPCRSDRCASRVGFEMA